MQFQPGTSVGSFEILSRLGAGGMGEVYRARDTKLGRAVALKVLPDSFATDPERLSRFQREAQVLASLNHPHIAAIYGLERSGDSQFLVLELVEGSTLQDRLTPTARGSPVALPASEAVAIARQIADALQAAHEKSIIHRDLKPSNIALTDDGQVKVLDFGLAKLESADGGRPSEVPDATAGVPLAGLSRSPTMMPAAMTGVGMILGTAPYMSPEQAKGRPADKRSDVWGFGCVLYEMLAGRPAFDGEDVSDTLANVLKTEPDWAALPDGLPAALRLLVRRCLEKDRRKRIADIAVALFILEDPALLAPSVAGAATVAPARRSIWVRALFPVVTWVAGALVAGAAVWFYTRPAPGRVARLVIAPAQASALAISGASRDFAVSPDGSHIAYVGAGSTMFLRAMDQLEPTVVAKPGAPLGPFFSPDNQWIGFFDNAVLKKVAMTGGAPISICPVAGNPRGAAWGADDTIVFATNDSGTGLWRVSAGGGEPTMLTRPNHAAGEGDHLWPEFLPDGRTVVFTVIPATSSLDNAQIAVFNLRTHEQKTVVRGGSDAHYVASGHLVYGAAGALRAVRFNLDRLEASTTPVTVLPQAATTPLGAANFDVSADGTLVYVPLGNLGNRTLVWIDRQGHEEPLNVPPRAYQYPRISPDGTRIALDIRDQDNDIWMWDLSRHTLSRFTLDPAPDRFPAWTPDGRRLVFASDRSGLGNVYWQAVDGTGLPHRVTTSPNLQVPMSVVPDGTQIIVREAMPSNDLVLVPIDGDGRSRPLVNTPFAEQNGEVSPDGRWLAYESNETGPFEVYVRPYPKVETGRWQVTSGGGVQPAWARNGRELFYAVAGGALMRVQVEKDTSWTASTPTKVFDGQFIQFGAGGGGGRSYDVSPDGKRFLMIKQGGGADRSTLSPGFIVVQNWAAELNRLVR